MWSDKAKTTPISQPVELDSAGEAQIWFDGTVDIRVEKSDTTLLYTMTGIESSPTIAVSGEFNMLTNGSFEDDTNGDGNPDGWSLSPEANAIISIDSDSGNQTHGSNSLHFDASGGTAGGGTALSDIFAVEEGNGLTVSWSHKQVDAPTGTYVVDVIYYDYAGDLVSSEEVWESTAGLAEDTWVQYSNVDLSPVVPAGSTQARIQLTGLGNGGTDETGECWFDNVSCIDPLGLVTLTGTQTLTNKDIPIIYDTNGNETLILGETASAVNEITITNAATGDRPTISSSGEADIGINFENSEGEELLELIATPTAVNNVRITNAITGNAAVIDCSETNSDLELTANGTGDVTKNGAGLLGLVWLPTSQALTTTPPTNDTWTTLDMSTAYAAAATAGAKVAIINVYAENSLTEPTLNARLYVSLRKKGDTTNNVTCQVAGARQSYEDGTTTTVTTLHVAGQAHVALDSNSDFEYNVEMVSGTVDTLNISLVGYYV